MELVDDDDDTHTILLLYIVFVQYPPPLLYNIFSFYSSLSLSSQNFFVRGHSCVFFTFFVVRSSFCSFVCQLGGRRSFRVCLPHFFFYFVCVQYSLGDVYMCKQQESIKDNDTCIMQVHDCVTQCMQRVYQWIQLMKKSNVFTELIEIE